LVDFVESVFEELVVFELLVEVVVLVVLGVFELLVVLGLKILKL